MRRASRWWVAGLVTVAAFAVTAWVMATFVLLPVIALASDRWVAAAGAGTAVAAVSALWGQSWVTRRDAEDSGSAAARVPQVSNWVERRELSEVVSALTSRGSAVITALVGAGGFGKTTLAAKACRDRRVQRRFRDGITWVHVGRTTAGPALAAVINEAIATMAGRP